MLRFAPVGDTVEWHGCEATNHDDRFPDGAQLVDLSDHGAHGQDRA